MPEFFEWDRLISSSYFKSICELVHFENEVRNNLKKGQDSTTAVSAMSMEIDYRGEVLDTTVARLLQEQSKVSLNFDMLVSQPIMVAAGVTAEQPIKHNFSLNTYLGLFDSKYTVIARFARASLLNMLTREPANQSLKAIDKQLDHLLQAIKELPKADPSSFWIYNRRETLLKPNAYDQLNQSIGQDMFSFERKCLEIEHALFTSLHVWQNLNEFGDSAKELLSGAVKTFGKSLCIGLEQ